MKETAQDLKIKKEVIKKTQTEGINEVKNLGKWIRTSDARLTNELNAREGKEHLRSWRYIRGMWFICQSKH